MRKMNKCFLKQKITPGFKSTSNTVLTGKLQKKLSIILANIYSAQELSKITMYSETTAMHVLLKAIFQKHCKS